MNAFTICSPARCVFWHFIKLFFFFFLFFTGGGEQRLIKCVNDKYQLREEETKTRDKMICGLGWMRLNTQSTGWEEEEQTTGSLQRRGGFPALLTLAHQCL